MMSLSRVVTNPASPKIGKQNEFNECSLPDLLWLAKQDDDNSACGSYVLYLPGDEIDDGGVVPEALFS